MGFSLFRYYNIKLVFRVAAFGSAVMFYLGERDSLAISKWDWCFTQGIKPLNLIWLLLISGMMQKFFPLKIMSMGCRKHFKSYYIPVESQDLSNAVKAWRKTENLAAFKVLFAWLSLNAAPALLYFQKIWGESEMLLVSLFYYVCDLICVLFYCPFQSWLMKNRCCVTCRIFNWDALMICTPLFFVRSDFSWSLIVIAFVLLFCWEWAYWKYPERFWESGNQNLQCKRCQERLCRFKKSLHCSSSEVF